MRNTFILIISLVGALIIAAFATHNSKISHEALKSGFITPSDSIQTSVYWYWISDNISKEGVSCDLHSMKQACINQASIKQIIKEKI